MPFNRRLYPPDWEQISRRVKDAAGWCCQGSPAYPDCQAEHGKPHPVTGSVVVLTVAHLDHNPQNNHPANLRAWCQRCHNTYDHPHRRQNAVRTISAKKRLVAARAGQISFPLPGEETL